MDPHHGQRYRQLAEAAWRWVLDHVADDAGPWIPQVVSVDDDWRAHGIPRWRDGMHDGIGGLTHALAEIRRLRAWTTAEAALAQRITDRIRAQIPTRTDYTYFDGLASDIGVFVSLGATDHAAAACDRLMALARPDGWPQVSLGADRVTADARINDATLGTAGVLLAAIWAQRHGVPNARAVADHAANVLIAEAEPVPSGLNWRFVPRRFQVGPGAEMPNWSHGLAGIAATLALGGSVLDRPEPIDAAAAGAEHLVTLSEARDDGFVVPIQVPPTDPDGHSVAYGWCHGSAGTSLLFLALEHAGVDRVAGEPPLSWHRRCLRSVRGSGLPDRRYPGFWDNDGRCCGTAGVGDIFLDSWCRTEDEQYLDFAIRLADALVEHAVIESSGPGSPESEPRAYWRFVEHRNPEPLLPPGVGWMQGAAGIAAYLFRLGRVLDPGSGTSAVARMDNWWALPVTPAAPVAGP